MKIKIAGLLGVAGAMLIFSLAAQAEVLLAKANIPFSFTVGDKTFPAGTYTVGREGGPRSVYSIRSLYGKEIAFFMPAPIEPKVNNVSVNTLLFDHVGESYFLSKVMLGSWDEGLKLPRSKHEKELLAQGASESPVEVASTVR